MSKKRWSLAQVMQAVRLRADGSDFEVIAETCDRSLKSVLSKLRDVKANTVEGARRVVAEGISRDEHYAPHHVAPSPPLAPEMIEERDRVYEQLAQRDLTAVLLGDPPRDRSALAMKMREETR